jgi:hypothetical protein
MRRRLAVAGLALSLAWPVGGAAKPAGTAVPDPVCVRVLLARLRAAGRAEATIRLRRRDVVSGRTVEQAGRLALEPPRRARLDFAGGERLTLRADGGEWLQPALRQLVRAGPRGAAGALQWWGALLDPVAAGLEERRLDERSFALRLRGSETSAPRIELDAQGLPVRLVLAGADGGSLEYRLRGWRFVRARGEGDFRLAAPPGVEIVNLP